MFYKEWKYFAAHQVLKVLRKHQGWTILNENGSVRPPVYQWANTYQIKESSPFYFSKEVLSDAARMMFIEYKHPDNEVDMLLNSNDSYLSEFRLLDKGLVALKEAKYKRMFFTSWWVIASALVGGAAAILGVIKVVQELSSRS